MKTELKEFIRWAKVQGYAIKIQYGKKPLTAENFYD
jgi:hypothetical protein